MLAKLWSDESGAILSAELILVMVILVIGVSVGLVAVRDAVDCQLVEVALAIASIDTSFSYDGISYDGFSEGIFDSTATVADSQHEATFNALGLDTVGDILTVIEATEEKDAVWGS